MFDGSAGLSGPTLPEHGAGAECGSGEENAPAGRTAFVTGASGFIGRHLTHQLRIHGWRVRCLVRATSSVRPLCRAGAELVRGDVTQPERLTAAIAGADVVFHVAGVTAGLRRADYFRVNQDGTWNVARACAAQGRPPTLVVVSSLAAAGPTVAGRVRTEADPPAPVSIYGCSKRAGELAAEAWSHCVPTTILRPGIVFGEWNRELLPVFRLIARIGVHVVPTFSPPPLSYIHVADFVRLTIAAADHGTRVTAAQPARGYYFAAAPEYPTYRDFGRMVGRLLGHPRVLVLPLAEPVVWVAAGVTEAVSFLRRQAVAFNVDKAREAIAESWACSPAAAQRDLGFAPPLGLEQRLEETLHWYRTRRWL